jgi:hypothetical protein
MSVSRIINGSMSCATSPSTPPRAFLTPSLLASFDPLALSAPVSRREDCRKSVETQPNDQEEQYRPGSSEWEGDEFSVLRNEKLSHLYGMPNHPVPKLFAQDRRNMLENL